MAPTTSLSSHERTRVEDYLNDKIQISADLESLNSLLSSLRAQQELQRKQLTEAHEALSNATKASNNHAEATRKRAEAFAAEQAGIDQRLKAITQSETSDEAVRRLEKSMVKLQRLEISKGYVGLLKEAEELSKEALSSISSDPRTALKPYSQLRSIVVSLKEAQPAAEGAAPHLIDYTEKLASALREQLKKFFGDQLQKTLTSLKWPTRELNITDKLLDQWRRDVELLIDLQTPELPHRDVLSISQKVEPPGLFPLEVMVHPLELRFKYHFSGEKPTNRLDKPEYFLSHVLDLINQFGGFFTSYFQPILNEKAQSAGVSLEWNFNNALHAFINALMPMLRKKIDSFLPQISDYPQLLSHFIHELMNFDNEIRETWNYLPDPYSDGNWKGMTGEVLAEQGSYDRWLQVEKDFALARYKDIIDTADSGEIDYDGVELTATKPTKAAIRVNDLLETITERYQPLSSFSQKLRFLIDIQITIFDQFHERLYSALEAYLAMTSTLGRTVRGADGQASVEDVAGLERLCRVFGSAEYLEKKMEDWSNDVFFVELWSELQDRVRQGGQNVAGSMTVAEVAARTSPAVNNNGLSSPQTSSDGALFDETASAYRRLRQRSEAIVTSTLTSNITAVLKPYSRVSTWATLSVPSAGSASSPLSLSSDLAHAMRTLSSQLAFLSKALGVAPLRRVSRQLLLSIQTYVWDHVLTRNTFSTAGANQLVSDVEQICSVVDNTLGVAGHPGGSLLIMKKLNEALRLLNLRPSTTDSDEAANASNTVLSLWDVEKRLFKDNENARAVLVELEIDALTEAEARSVLGRRVEVGS